MGSSLLHGVGPAGQVVPELSLASVAVRGERRLRVLFREPLHHEPVEDRAHRRSRLLHVAKREDPPPHAGLNDPAIDLDAPGIEALVDAAERLPPSREPAEIDERAEEGAVAGGRWKDHADERPDFLARILDGANGVPHAGVNRLDQPAEELEKQVFLRVEVVESYSLRDPRPPGDVVQGDLGEALFADLSERRPKEGDPTLRFPGVASARHGETLTDQSVSCQTGGRGGR